MGCRMRIGLIVAGFSAALAIAGCTIDTVPMAPLNQQAQTAGGSPLLHFTRGMPFGEAYIVMPDGEILPGEFRVDEAAGQNFHAFGNGPRTRLVCLGTVSSGHGSADCRSQNGAVYRLTL
jgi:hypothetical protein